MKEGIKRQRLKIPHTWKEDRVREEEEMEKKQSEKSKEDWESPRSKVKHISRKDKIRF